MFGQEYFVDGDVEIDPDAVLTLSSGTGGAGEGVDNDLLVVCYAEGLGC